jgi:hypothetical protein
MVWVTQPGVGGGRFWWLFIFRRGWLSYVRHLHMLSWFPWLGWLSDYRSGAFSDSSSSRWVSSGIHLRTSGYSIPLRQYLCCLPLLCSVCGIQANILELVDEGEERAQRLWLKFRWRVATLGSKYMGSSLDLDKFRELVAESERNCCWRQLYYEHLLTTLSFRF